MRETYRSAAVTAARLVPNRWDFVAAPIVLGTLTLIAIGASEISTPLAHGAHSAISLDPRMLPDYALRTTLRLLAGLVVSLLFTFTYATLAAKSRRAGLVLMPILDILQSVPILGFVSFAVVVFSALLPGSGLAMEASAIFAIFTSQAWNMAFSFHASLRTLPRDLDEVCRANRLSAWQRFWRLEVPFALPSLVWNAMASMSAGWFFVVASESISVGSRTVALPGIGSYVALAIDQRDLPAIGWALLTMLVVIVVYDQLLFRPLVAWAEKFRLDQTPAADIAQSWVLRLLQRTRLLSAAAAAFSTPGHFLIQRRLGGPPKPRPMHGAAARKTTWSDCLLAGIVAIAAIYGAREVVVYISGHLDLADVSDVLLRGAATALRVLVLVGLASLVWVPLGVWIGLRPGIASAVQPLAQFLAAFPANLLFPVFVVGIVSFGLDPNVWLSPLMILGTQWYILFNVVAGASAFPHDLREAARHFRLRGWQWWRKAMIPGVFSYYVTGAIAASGGAWNASIVAEWVSWGDTRLDAYGLGSYIAAATADGDYPRIVAGIAVMCLFVVALNRLLWHRLYAYAERRLRFD